jgi:spermidine synthase
MPDWDVIDQEQIPGEDGVLYLMAQGDEYVIHVNGRELMGNTEHGSEDALAYLACDRLMDRDAARVLVGGLGMGFTMAAALRRLGPEAVVTVAELIPAVVRWNREYLGAAANHPLRDKRAIVHIGDVADLVETPQRPWSAILLDVDNGPRALTRPYNAWLYGKKGLKAAYEALIPGGVLGIWSAAPDSNLTRRLRETHFEVEVVPHVELERKTQDESGVHVLWMARRPATG